MTDRALERGRRINQRYVPVRVILQVSSALKAGALQTPEDLFALCGGHVRVYKGILAMYEDNGAPLPFPESPPAQLSPTQSERDRTRLAKSFYRELVNLIEDQARNLLESDPQRRAKETERIIRARERIRRAVLDSISVEVLIENMAFANDRRDVLVFLWPTGD